MALCLELYMAMVPIELQEPKVVVVVEVEVEGVNESSGCASLTRRR